VVAPDDLPRLRAGGVSAILSLQRPDVDLARSAIERMRAACEPGVAFRNVPVTDYDPADLVARLPAVLTVLRALVDDGRVVYVHCTEGVNRAPSVGLAHLVLAEEVPLADALAALARAAPMARPYPAVVRWLAAGGPRAS
jgi:protein-tyrosine phosphatase